MESNETDKTNTVQKRKREIRCGVCGSIAGKSGKDGAEFINDFPISCTIESA